MQWDRGTNMANKMTTVADARQWMERNLACETSTRKVLRGLKDTAPALRVWQRASALDLFWGAGRGGSWRGTYVRFVRAFMLTAHPDARKEIKVGPIRRVWDFDAHAYTDKPRTRGVSEQWDFIVATYLASEVLAVARGVFTYKAFCKAVRNG